MFLLSAGKQYSLIICCVIFTTINTFYRMNISFADLYGMFHTSHTVMIQKKGVLCMIEVPATMALYDFSLFVR